MKYISRFPESDQVNMNNLDRRLLQTVQTHSSIEDKLDKYDYQFIRNNINMIRDAK